MKFKILLKILLKIQHSRKSKNILEKTGKNSEIEKWRIRKKELQEGNLIYYYELLTPKILYYIIQYIQIN
jgi:hypothetical protein